MKDLAKDLASKVFVVVFVVLSILSILSLYGQLDKRAASVWEVTFNVMEVDIDSDGKDEACVVMFQGRKAVQMECFYVGETGEAGR